MSTVLWLSESFNSFELASAGRADDEANEFDASFNARRQEALAEVKGPQGTKESVNRGPPKRRFHPGGSK